MTQVRAGILGGTAPDTWRARLPAEQLITLDGSGRDRVDVVLVDGTAGPAVSRLRAMRETHPYVQPIIIAPDQQRAALEREVTLTPGLGEVWIVPLERLDGALLERAAQVTAQRSRHAALTTQRRATPAQQAAPPRRAVVTDSFLATVLQVARVAVFSLDAEDRIMTANPAAERLFELAEARALGKPIQDAIHAVDAEQFQRLLGHESVNAERVEFIMSDGRRGVFEIDLALVPHRPDGLRVLVAHDITEAAQQRALLEEQAAELEHQTEQLSEQTVRLEDAVATRDAALADVSHLMEARSRFYAAMNHEIRTPINAILGFNDLMLGGIYGELSGDVRNSVERSQRAARHLLELVNDVLDLSKIEAGRVDLALAEHFVPAIVQEVLQTMAPTIQASGSEVHCEFDCNEPVCTDDRRVRQILMNLLSNAAKFGEGKPITVRCMLVDEDVRIDVIDQGVGINQEQLTRIFDEFVQVREIRQRGTGLGLAISRKLSELLGGRIEVTSVEHEGSTFSLILPLKAAAELRSKRP